MGVTLIVTLLLLTPLNAGSFRTRLKIMRKAFYVLAALLLATGCSGGGQTASLSEDQSAPGPVAMPQSGARADAGSPGESAPEKAQPEVQRAIAYSATLRVRAEKVESSTAKAKELVAGAGGYVAEENTYGTPPTARLDFQVPAAKYTGVLDGLTKQLGEKISLQQSAEDVTEKVADVDSRVESSEAALKRLRTLLSQARTVGEVLQVTQELDQRQADLDALKARQKSLSKRVAEATITLVIVSEQAEPADEDSSGFLGGLKAGWEDFTGFVSGLLTATGWLLPFAPLLAGAFFLGRRLVRRRRARRRAGQAA